MSENLDGNVLAARGSPPTSDFDSPGSLGSVVSSGLKEEYDQLISHAIVVPRILSSAGQPSVPGLHASLRQELASNAQDRSRYRADDLQSPLSLRQELSASAAGGGDFQSSSGMSSCSTFASRDLTPGDQHDPAAAHRASPGYLRHPVTTGVQRAPLSVSSTPDLRQRHPTPSPGVAASGAATTGLRTVHSEHAYSGSPLRFDPTASYRGPGSSEAGIITIRETGQDAGNGDDGDQDLVRLEEQIDTMTNDLKQCVMAEFAQAKAKYKQRARLEGAADNERHAAQVSRLHHEMEDLRQLTSTLESSLKHKDQIIDNLTQSLNKQASRFQLQKTFSMWQINHCNTKRELFTGKLAARHYRKSLLRKVYNAWRGVLVQRWKLHVEKACKTKADQVCTQLATKYEQDLEHAQELLTAEQAKVEQLQRERNDYEAAMKRAFMRGVCALNMEAMGMFKADGSGSMEG